MAEIEDILAYFTRYYPRPGELSTARLALMLYLADWRSALLRKKPISNVKWHLNEGAPQVEKIPLEEEEEIIRELITRGNPNKIDPESREILDFVMKTSYKMPWMDFARLVSSTFPVITQPQGERLNLVGLAQQYQKHYQPLFTSK
jgi:hypothetical protein